VKLSTIFDLREEVTRLYAEQAAGYRYLTSEPRPGDYSAALRSYEDVCRKIHDLEAVISTWGPVALNEHERSPLLQGGRRRAVTTNDEHPAWHCVAAGCTEAIPPSVAFCGRHWSLLTPSLQTEITRLYKPEYAGITDSREWPLAYLQAAGRAIAFVARMEAGRR
jgi:hypothetical protein